MSSCYTDLPITKRSYATCSGVCSNTDYLKPIGEFTANYSVTCTGSTGATGPGFAVLFNPQQFKLKATVPTNQLVTFYINVDFTDVTGYSVGLFGGDHFQNVPVYANVSYGFDNNAIAPYLVNPADLYQLQLVYNPYLNGAVGNVIAKRLAASLLIKKGTQIYAGIH